MQSSHVTFRGGKNTPFCVMSAGETFSVTSYKIELANQRQIGQKVSLDAFMTSEYTIVILFEPDAVWTVFRFVTLFNQS
jgi:hypothetical protein